MTALAADRQTVQYPRGEFVSHPVKGSTKVYLGSLVCVGTDGYAVPAANTAGLKFAGVAQENADNSSGSDGAETIKVRRTGIAEFVASGLTVADQGKDLFVTDDQTVTTTPGNVRCGKLAFFESATVAPVDIQSAVQGGAEGPAETANDFVVSGKWNGVVGTTEVTERKFKLGKKARLRALFADAQTAPGAGYNCTVKVTEGTNPETVTIAETATHAEDVGLSQEYAAAAEMSVTLQDDNALAATADVAWTAIFEFVN